MRRYAVPTEQQIASQSTERKINRSRSEQSTSNVTAKQFKTIKIAIGFWLFFGASIECYGKKSNQPKTAKNDLRTGAAHQSGAKRERRQPNSYPKGAECQNLFKRGRENQGRIVTTGTRVARPAQQAEAGRQTPKVSALTCRPQRRAKYEGKGT